MILNRIQPYLEPLLRPNQNGFKPLRSTNSHILALRRIIEGVKAKNKKALIIFVDFSKAFDSVDQEKMLAILAAYGIPPKIVNAISLLYKDTKAKVISPDDETDKIDIITGVLQGDTLARYIFAMVVDFIMRTSIDKEASSLGYEIERKRSRKHQAKTVTDLCFSDIALVTE